MIKNKSIYLLPLLLVATGTAVAGGGGYEVKEVTSYETHQNVSSHQSNERGGYAGIGYGRSRLDASGATETYEDKNVRAYLGYDLNRYFAVEGGVGSIQLDNYLNDVGDITGIDVSVLAKLPVTSKLSAYARLGYWDWDFSGSSKGKSHNGHGGTDMLYGLGVDYKVSPRFKLRLDATRYEADDAYLDTLNASIAYKW